MVLNRFGGFQGGSCLRRNDGGKRRIDGSLRRKDGGLRRSDGVGA